MTDGHSDYLLAIETSCDETAAAIIDRQRNVLSSVVATQTELHEIYGGVVPEIASRAHVERILPVIDQALRDAGIALDQLAAVAVATQPGLVGSLLVGLTAAKTIALTLGIPLVAVDHIQAHIYACRMSAAKNIYPCIGFVVSGGHTNLYHCQSPVEFELIGSTIDDAAGEAFDKVAQILGLPYPGGPSIQNIAANGNPNAIRFPRTFLKEDRLDFSFSGLKTAVLYETHGQPGKREAPPELTPQRMADIAASFQAAVVEVLTAKARQALKRYDCRTLCVGGGVAANGPFRESLERLAERDEIELIVAPLSLCTDNAAMGAIGWELLEAGKTATLDIDVVPGLVRKSN